MFSAQAIAALRAREVRAYEQSHPASARLAQRSALHWQGGVPFQWMRDWGLPFPLFVRSALGAALVDADGRSYDDFCLGDTGAMFGHSPTPVARALTAQSARGLTAMLPGEQVAEIGAALAARFGLPCWQLTQSASDANREALRWARAITGRRDVLVFNGCYHGAVDEIHVLLGLRGAQPRAGLRGMPFDVAAHTRVVEFNDLAALAGALGDAGVAAVLCEPALTNMGIVLPEPGFHAELRRLTRQQGSLLIIDETHTLSAGPGGCTRRDSLTPDVLVCGKAIAGGMPCGLYGYTEEVRARIEALPGGGTDAHSGLGTTLSANLALPWQVQRVGARVELGFGARPARNGRESAAAMRPELERALHLYLLNRGVLLTPFHNMMLLSPDTGDAAVGRLLAALDGALGELAA